MTSLPRTPPCPRHARRLRPALHAVPINGMRHLAELSSAGMNTVPAADFDIATIPEARGPEDRRPRVPAGL